MDNSRLLEALQCIPPAELDYNQWCQVGMALKQEGFTWEIWDGWSKTDPRYHDGECEKKWRSFRGQTGNPVTGGTLVDLARKWGFNPINRGEAFDWDDEISAERDELVVINRDWLEGKTLPSPLGTPVQQITTYLETLFDTTDLVGYVVDTWEKDGRFMPQKGNWDRTAGQLIEELGLCDGKPELVFGDTRSEVGAWIRFNPLDGNGVRNENVTAFNFALVESDDMSIEEQYAAYEAMELPIAALVFSGGKSLHAIVRVDAPNYSEYQKRVDYLYKVCEKNGLKIDRQNRNPSRLSRMPGVMRNGHQQSLLAVNIGKGSWDEWREWIEAVNDDLPDEEDEIIGERGNLAPALIDGVLRQGHKLLLAGPSKAGKSFALIELAICISEGIPWMGFQCAKGKVMYVNLELDKESCKDRFAIVREAMKAPSTQGVKIWNLRGHSVPMDKLAPKLIRRASKGNYTAIIIDPIYKVITGDENSADQMAKFCNQFDKVCTELGGAVIYCHHHSKGAQGGKRSMDRASGSGVFARDPDALLDMIELPLTDEARSQRKNNAVCRLCGAYLERFDQSDKVSQDDLCSRKAALDACMDFLPTQAYNALLDEVAQTDAQEAAVTAWRIEGTLREFPRFPALNVWFEYPVHHVDRSGVLADIQPEAEQPAWKKNFGKKKSNHERAQERKADLDSAFAMLSSSGPVTVKALCEYLDVKPRTLQKHIKESGKYWSEGWTENSEIGMKASAQNTD